MTKLADKLDATQAAQQQGVAIQKAGTVTSVLGWLNAPTTKQEIARALPRGLDADRFARVILTEVRKNPALLEASAPSFVLAVINMAQLGLFPGPLGHCYLTGPFRNSKTGQKEVVPIIGYKGLQDLAFRSKTIDILDSVAVHEGEPFKVIRGSDNRVEHVELAECQDKPIVAVYAIAFQKGSNRAVFEVMYPAEIEKIRQRSRAKDDGPWKTDTESMWLKTPMRRMLNRGKVRLSVDVAEAIALDEARELGHDRPELLSDLPALTDAPNGAEGTDTAQTPPAAAKEPVQPTAADSTTSPKAATAAAGAPAADAPSKATQEKLV